MRVHQTRRHHATFSLHNIARNRRRIISFYCDDFAIMYMNIGASQFAPRLIHGENVIGIFNQNIAHTPVFNSRFL